MNCVWLLCCSINFLLLPNTKFLYVSSSLLFPRLPKLEEKEILLISLEESELDDFGFAWFNIGVEDAVEFF